MSYNLKEIAAISGMSGLYRIVKPTRTGVIIESLEEQPSKGVAQARQRISLLEEDTVPLKEVFSRIKKQYENSLPVNAKSSGAELTDFMEEIVPEYDQERVYTSDMKKIVTWYEIISKFLPFTEEEEKDEKESDATPTASKQPPATEGSQKKKKAAEK
jgi:hypothetical protein